MGTIVAYYNLGKRSIISTDSSKRYYAEVTFSDGTPGYGIQTNVNIQESRGRLEKLIKARGDNKREHTITTGSYDPPVLRKRKPKPE